MIPISKFLESLNREFKILYTKHFDNRYEERIDFELLPIDKVDEFIDKGYVHPRLKSINHNQEYLIYSLSNEQGIVVNYDIKDKLFTIITILPPKKQNPKPGTIKIYVEEFFNNYNYSKSFVNYLGSFLDDSIELDKEYDYQQEMIELNKEVKLQAVFVNAKLFNILNYVVLEID